MFSFQGFGRRKAVHQDALAPLGLKDQAGRRRWVVGPGSGGDLPAVVG
jgi:hypothetical protein